MNALVALAAHGFDHANFVAFAVIVYCEFNGRIGNVWSAKCYFLAIHNHQHGFDFDFLAFFLSPARNTKGITLADNFLEPGDIDNDKHGENAESGASVRRIQKPCKGKCTFTYNVARLRF